MSSMSMEESKAVWTVLMNNSFSLKSFDENFNFPTIVLFYARYEFHFDIIRKLLDIPLTIPTQY
jgi:ABC-type sulfate transport system permease component